jgi:putative intracellular protease/amidase
MTKKTIAFLASNGIDEKIVSTFQRLISNTRTDFIIKIVSTEKALIQTWSGKDWGYSMAVNEKVDTALSGDYEVLILAGSDKSIAKLGSNPHSTRFIEGFQSTNKPIIAISEGVQFLEETIGYSADENIMKVKPESFEAENALEILSFIDGLISDIAVAA